MSLAYATERNSTSDVFTQQLGRLRSIQDSGPTSKGTEKTTSARASILFQGLPLIQKNNTWYTKILCMAFKTHVFL